MGPAPARREVLIAVALFVATLATSVVSYAVFFGEAPVGARLPNRGELSDGLAFGSALLAILLAHEMGHYVVARLHGFALSLPWFVPFPNLFGTLGAVIRLRSLPRTRQALLEMGVAGPMAGAVVAFVLLWVSLPWVEPGAPLAEGEPIMVFQDPLLVSVVGFLTTGAPPDRLAVYHPVTMAAWVGCFLTGVNLLPIGQLDGGHVLNAAAPRVARLVSRVGPLLLIAAGYWWPGWIVWGVLLLLLSAGRPLPVAEHPPLPLRSRVLAALALVLFALTFLPAPIVEETFRSTP